MIKLETQPWCLISTGSCGVGLVVILVGVWPVIIITWQYPGWWPVPGLTWRLSCWQWRWPLGTSCAHSAAQHRSRQPGGRRNAGTQPQPGAGWGTPGSSFLRGERIKLCQNCHIFLHASAQNGAALQSLKVYHEVQKFFMKCWVFCCLPSAPGLGMLAVLAVMVTARVFYQISMLGWSAEGLSPVLYFQLLFCLHESMTGKFWHAYCVCCLLLVWPVYLPVLGCLSVWYLSDW